MDNFVHPDPGFDIPSRSVCPNDSQSLSYLLQQPHTYQDRETERKKDRMKERMRERKKK